MSKVTVEEWKDIPGFEGKYKVSSHGMVMSLSRYVGHNYGGSKLLAGRILSLSTLPGGYKTVNLRSGGKTYHCRVNRLVLSAFVGLPDEKIVACHIDNNPSNNKLENLRWDTYSGNEADKIIFGTSNRGERNTFAILTEKNVYEIRSMLSSGI